MIWIVATWIALSVAVGLALFLADRSDRHRWVDHEDLTEHELERQAMGRAVERCRQHHPTSRTRETIR